MILFVMINDTSELQFSYSFIGGNYLVDSVPQIHQTGWHSVTGHIDKGFHTIHT